MTTSTCILGLLREDNGDLGIVGLAASSLRSSEGSWESLVRFFVLLPYVRGVLMSRS